MNECRFCEILENSETRLTPQDKILFENASFYIVPALGCLVKNYILIISKRHINSIAYLNEQEKKDFKALLALVRNIYIGKYGFEPIIFEHGGSNLDTNKSACCIMHAHLHIVPIELNCQQDMINSLGLENIENLDEFYISAYDKPYILFVDNSGKIYLRNLTDTVMPSQVMRQWVSKDIGLKNNEWDWRVHDFKENIETTVDELTSAFKNKRRFNNIYYCRAMDGLDQEDIKREYAFVLEKLAKLGINLVNNICDENFLEINKANAEKIVKQNKRDIDKSDCLIVNMSIENHTYIGCVAEMVYAKQQGKYIVVITGDTKIQERFYTLYLADETLKRFEDITF